MTRAYNECYLSNAKDRLSQFFDYAIHDCNFKSDQIAMMFVVSGYAEQFERGNPAILAGMSGIELAQAVIEKTYKKQNLPEPKFRQDRSSAYWAGWALAEYQWYTGRRFKDIFKYTPLSKIIALYAVYHEMDISQFIETMEQFYQENHTETKLKQIRKNRGLSQTALATQAGVNLRSIQMYEQKENDIDKAQAGSLYKLSRVLGCNIEDLLENP
ncbi:MAG: helix-turn-helix transcriptional regulator [Clostridia bacterium]|nr:helix-turn-helix transcriptional regulator [Clostridia bacterium]